MEDRQFENQNLNSDLFQEYIDSLPEENSGEETAQENTQESASASSHLSEQVEKDLLDYQRRGYDARRKKDTRERRTRTRRNADGVKYVIAACAGLVIVASTMFAVGTVRTTNSYTEYEYFDPYEYGAEYYSDEDEEYQQMSGLLSNPEIYLNGRYVALPLTMSDFMQEDWTVRTSAFSENAETVGSEPVSLHIMDKWSSEEIAEISVVSPSGEEVPLEDGLIIGLYTDSAYYWYELNGGVYVGSSSWTVEEALSEEGLDWTERGSGNSSRYIIEAPAENDYGYDEYVLRLEMEDDTVQRITMQLSKSASETGE